MIRVVLGEDFCLYAQVVGSYRWICPPPPSPPHGQIKFNARTSMYVAFFFLYLYFSVLFSTQILNVDCIIKLTHFSKKNWFINTHHRAREDKAMVPVVSIDWFILVCKDTSIQINPYHHYFIIVFGCTVWISEYSRCVKIDQSICINTEWYSYSLVIVKVLVPEVTFCWKSGPADLEVPTRGLSIGSGRIIWWYYHCAKWSFYQF